MKAKTIIRKDFTVGRIDERLFGSFVEHMGSVVSNGLFQPGHRLSNEKGYRMDVLKLLQTVGLTLMRYPGGNYTSAYRWEDTVGAHRPATLNLAWREKEPNQFGLHEFFDWNSNLGCKPVMTINLGTRGAQQAADLVEYMNLPQGTKFADMRAKNGAKDPFGVKMWCLGNELDGDWQMGHKRPKEYGNLADITAQLMKQVDPSIELIAVGSSNVTLDNYPEWNRKVLMQCYDRVDYIALHKYLSSSGMDEGSYLCSPLLMDQMIETVCGIADYVGSVKRSKHRVNISFDEYNVGPDVADGDLGEWPVGPRRDCVSFRQKDVLVQASMLMSLIRHADRVKIGCQSLLVNDIGLVITEDEGAYLNGIAVPLIAMSKLARGTALHSLQQGDTIETKEFGAQSALDVVSVLGDDGSVRAFVVNRSREAVDWTLDMRDFGFAQPKAARRVMAGAPDARNSLQNPDVVRLAPAEAPAWNDGCLRARLEPLSFSVVEVR